MDASFRASAASAAVLLVLAGCNAADSPSPATPASPPSSAPAPPVSVPAPTPLPPLPEVSGHEATPTAGARASSDQKAPLTKAEEVKSMPKPGQANDHSSSSLGPVRK